MHEAMADCMARTWSRSGEVLQAGNTCRPQDFYLGHRAALCTPLIVAHSDNECQGTRARRIEMCCMDH
jgi:hypothetical protein